MESCKIARTQRTDSGGSNWKIPVRTPASVSLSRSYQCTGEFQARTDEEILRADECRHGVMAGFGKLMGRSHKSRAGANGFPSHRYWIITDQRNVATINDSVIDSVAG